MKCIKHSKQFKKDFKRVNKRGLDTDKFFKIIEYLRKGVSLGKKHKPHKLLGEYKNYTECHIESDWLLIYKVDEDFIELYRTGSHSDLF